MEHMLYPNDNAEEVTPDTTAEVASVSSTDLEVYNKDKGKSFKVTFFPSDMKPVLTWL